MVYDTEIQKASKFIEDHLQEELSLECVSGGVGFSMYHFHRIFQKEVGMTVADYIRRRITNAASMLLYTKERILDIAHLHRFESQDQFATMMPSFKANKYKGKRLKLSAFIKTETVEGFCGLWRRVDNASDDILQFDNMSNRPITKTTNWNRYSIVLDVPENSATISFGVLLNGKGHV